MIKKAAIIVILSLMLVLPVTAFWNTRVIDGAGTDVGKYCSLKIDDQGRAHILYYSETDQNLKYAWQPWKNISSWMWTTIIRGENNGKWGSLWVSKNGDRFTFSCTNASGVLFVGEGSFRPGVRDASSPAVSNLVQVGVAGAPYRQTQLVHGTAANQTLSEVFANLAWDPSQGGGLAYYTLSGCRASAPQSCPGTPATGGMISDDYYGEGFSAGITRENSWNDPRGICFFNRSMGTLEYVECYAAAPLSIPHVIDGSQHVQAGYYCSLAFDHYGLPHISYKSMEGTGELKHAWKDRSGIWHNETVDNSSKTGDYTSIVIDKKDVPHISYVARENELWYASVNESGWYTERIDFGGQFSNPSIDVDGQDRPRIAYYDSSGGDLKFAWWEPRIRARPFP